MFCFPFLELELKYILKLVQMLKKFFSKPALNELCLFTAFSNLDQHFFCSFKSGIRRMALGGAGGRPLPHLALDGTGQGGGGLWGEIFHILRVLLVRSDTDRWFVYSYYKHSFKIAYCIQHCKPGTVLGSGFSRWIAQIWFLPSGNS